MGGHEDPGAAFFGRTLTSQTVDFAIVVHTVVFQVGQIHFLMFVFDLLGSGVVLLLAFLATSTETKDQVKGRF